MTTITTVNRFQFSALMQPVRIILVGLVLFGPVAANATLIDISGSITAATGAFSALTPPGTPIAGNADVDDTAFGMGSADATDINSIDLAVGGFCFSTEMTPGCIGALVPIISIDAAALVFSMGDVGGTLDVTAFSPTFGLDVLISVDFDAGTFSASDVAMALGTVSGVISATYAVSEPVTLGLLGLGLAGLGVVRRRKRR